MREIEKTYDNLESQEWRQELIELLSSAVYDYLKREGLLRAERKLAEGSGETAERTAPPFEAGGRGEEGGQDCPCKE